MRTITLDEDEMEMSDDDRDSSRSSKKSRWDSDSLKVCVLNFFLSTVTEPNPHPGRKRQPSVPSGSIQARN